MVTLEIVTSKLIRELVAALPSRWQDRIGYKGWTIIGPESVPNPLGLSKQTPIAMTVRAQDILVRQIEFPLASTFQITDLMQFEASRHVPLPLEDARLDFRIINRDIPTSRTLVELAIIRREAVETGIQRAGMAGLKVEAIYLHTANGPWLARRPLALKWSERWFSHRHQSQYLRAAIPILLFLMWVLAAQSWASRLEANRDAAEVMARSRAAGIEPLRIQLTALNNKLGYLARTRERISAAGLTEEIARLLPDNSWLQELDIENQTVRMLGIAQNATDLLQDFSSSPFFANVQFEAPLTQAIGVDGEQFDILMTRR